VSEPKNGKSVLAIDDDAMARDIYRVILEEAGFAVTLAADGPKGLAAFKGGKFDCVIVDIYMPGMTGLDVIEALDPEKNRVPILAISGGGEQTGAHPLRLAATLGAVKSMNKDFEHEELVRAVRELTGLE
jgi:CheY-like chemotaxis protein